MNRKWMVFLAAVLCLIGPSSVCADNGIEYKHVEIEIPVFCMGEDCKKNFFYQLKCEPLGSQIVKSDILSLKNGETGMFQILFYDVGTYHYEICQTDVMENQISDNLDAYCVDIWVMQDALGKLYGETVLYKKGNSAKEEKCVFYNEDKRKQTKIFDKKNKENVYSFGIRQAACVETGDETENTAMFLLCIGMLGEIVFMIFRIKQRRKGGG